MARKISVAALRQTLEDSKRLLEASVKHHHWMVAKCWSAVNFGGDAALKDKSVELSLLVLEEASRTLRDIDHALAALEGAEDE